MTVRFALLVATALLAQANASAAAAKESQKTFAQRLDAGEIVFAQTPMMPLDAAQLADLHPISDPPLSHFAETVLTRLIAVLPGPKPVGLPFVLMNGAGFNCTTIRSGGAIGCTAPVIELLGSSPLGQDEMAFLLAHELAHATIAAHRQRFERSEKLKAGWTRFGMEAAMISLMALSKYSKTGDTVNVTATPTASLVFVSTMMRGADVGEFVNSMEAPAWTRSDEDDADAFAVILMSRAGFNPTAAAQLLGALQRALDAAKDNSSTARDMAKNGAANAAMQALLTKGNVLSVVSGAAAGVVSAWSRDHAESHYHHNLPERMNACADEARLVMKPATASSRLALASKSGETGSLAGAPVADAPAAAATASQRQHSPVATSSGVSTAWAAFQRSGRQTPADIVTSMTVRKKIAANDFKGAAGLCPLGASRTQQLSLACGMAFAGLQDARRANPLLHAAITAPNVAVTDYQQVAQAQASLGQIPLALQTIGQGETKYPEGALFPTEILVRGGAGDMNGAIKANDRCQQASDKNFHNICRQTLVSLQTKQTTPKEQSTG